MQTMFFSSNAVFITIIIYLKEKKIANKK